VSRRRCNEPEDAGRLSADEVAVRFQEHLERVRSTHAGATATSAPQLKLCNRQRRVPTHRVLDLRGGRQ
jgi:hypothetical protein